jgi:hypothetical protein
MDFLIKSIRALVAIKAIELQILIDSSLLLIIKHQILKCRFVNQKNQGFFVGECQLTENLLHRNRFGQISGLIYITSS